MSVQATLVIADDDPIVREVLVAALESRFSVHAFASGHEALEFLQTQAVDLLLLDVDMPGVDGYETCRRLREGSHHDNLPVIFVSACAQLEDRLRGYAAGGNDYLTKPFDIDELHAKILLAIDQKRRTHNLAGEVAELCNAALLTAEMMGEVGVVLEFHRELTQCTHADQVADAVVGALARLGHEGCMRLRQRRLTITRSGEHRASALEASLLDHLEARPDARIVTLGHNLGFSFGQVTLLVRSPSWTAHPDSAETADQMGRARDNVALLCDGAVARLQALDAEDDAQQLNGARRLIDATRETLDALKNVEHEVHSQLDQVFESMRETFEMHFPRLGLTSVQEEQLAEIVTRHRERGLAVLARGREAEIGLNRLIGRLESVGPSGAQAAG